MALHLLGPPLSMLLPAPLRGKQLPLLADYRLQLGNLRMVPLWVAALWEGVGEGTWLGSSCWQMVGATRQWQPTSGAQWGEMTDEENMVDYNIAAKLGQ